MKVYSVRDWSKYYENNRTADMKVMRWVPFPNRHDGDGYTQMVAGDEGTEIFAAWVACVQVASRCEPRGTLLRKNGTLLRPHDAESLSRMTRLKVSAFENMFNRASSPEVGWLEVMEVDENGVVMEIPQEPAEIPQEPARKGMEGNGMEGNGIITAGAVRAAAQKRKPVDQKHQVPPELAWVLDHGRRLMLSEDECQKFYDYYETNGWLVGRSKARMKNWHSAMQNWKRTASDIAMRFSHQDPPPARNAGLPDSFFEKLKEEFSDD